MFIRVRAKTCAFYAVLGFAALGGVASAGDITYDVDRTIGPGTITGSITTDGHIGILTTSDIVSWTLTLSDPNLVGGSPDTISSASAAQTALGGNDLVASATRITFNFDSADFGGAIFQGSDLNGWCFDNLTGGCAGLPQVETLFFTTNFAEVLPQTGTQVLARAVPEPTTLALFGLGVAGIGLMRRRLNAR